MRDTANDEKIAENCARLIRKALLAAGFTMFDAVPFDTDDHRPHVRVVRTKPHFLGYIVALDDDGTWSIAHETMYDTDGAASGLHAAYRVAARLVAQIAEDFAVCAFSPEDFDS